MQRLTLITSFFRHPSPERHKEYLHVLRTNMANPGIHAIHLFVEPADLDWFRSNMSEEIVSSEKLVFIDTESQPTYRTFFAHALGLSETSVMIANSDIEIRIDADSASWLSALLDQGVVFFLTRHEHDLTRPLIDRYGGSHDAIVFNPRLLASRIAQKDESLLPIDYVQNTVGIEAIIIIWLVEKLNLELRNPCFQIMLVHHHKTETRGSYRCIGYTANQVYNHGIYKGKTRNSNFIRPEVIELE